MIHPVRPAVASLLAVCVLAAGCAPQARPAQPVQREPVFCLHSSPCPDWREPIPIPDPAFYPLEGPS